MEYKLVQQYVYIIVVTIHTVVSNRQNECQKLKSDSTIHHCPDNKCPAKYSDKCSSIMPMLVGIDKTNKGLQLQTRNQLSDLENKIADIMHKIDPCSSSPCVNGKCSKFNDGFKCTCKVGFSGETCTDTVTATDCFNLKQQDKESTNGVYMLRLWRTKKNLEVYCDMNTDAGGWTVFQNRFNGDVDFYRDFKDYEDGFGDVYEEYWLGLKYIEELASQGTTELRLELTAADGSFWFETYSDFRLSLPPDYHFNLAGGINGTGNAHYRMMLYNGLAFTTRDKDSDLDTRNDLDTQEDLNCGKLDHSGWWFGFCMANHFANLNGEYCRPGGVSSYNSGYGGMMYKDFKDIECLRTTRMMIRRTMTNT